MMKFGLAKSAASAVALVLGVGAVAQFAAAETLPVSGIYPARNDAAAEVNSIAIENFTGDKGTSLSFAITDALEGAVVNGEPYFILRPANDGQVDAVMRGYAAVEVIEVDLDDKKVVKCKKKDADKKCIKEKVTFYACTELTVSFYPNVRLTATEGGTLYSKRDTLSESEQYCADDYSIPSTETMLDGLVQSFARRVRFDLAPSYRDQNIRILESRRDLNKDAKKPFKNAVRLTKSDAGSACTAFGALEEGNPQHMSVLFNVGLCAEGMGDLERAQDYYRRALEAEPGKDYPESGLTRIASRYRAQRQLDVHYRRADDAEILDNSR